MNSGGHSRRRPYHRSPLPSLCRGTASRGRLLPRSRVPRQSSRPGPAAKPPSGHRAAAAAAGRPREAAALRRRLAPWLVVGPPSNTARRVMRQPQPGHRPPSSANTRSRISPQEGRRRRRGWLVPAETGHRAVPPLDAPHGRRVQTPLQRSVPGDEQATRIAPRSRNIRVASPGSSSLPSALRRSKGAWRSSTAASDFRPIGSSGRSIRSCCSPWSGPRAAAAASWGAAAMAKMSPALYLVGWLSRRQWRPVVTAGGTAIGLSLLALPNPMGALHDMSGNGA